jgi:hypothetical protein
MRACCCGVCLCGAGLLSIFSELAALLLSLLLSLIAHAPIATRMMASDVIIDFRNMALCVLVCCYEIKIYTTTTKEGQPHLKLTPLSIIYVVDYISA